MKRLRFDVVVAFGVTVAVASLLASALVFVGPTASPVSAQPVESRFRPLANITVENIDRDGDGVHDLDGRRIEIKFYPVAGSLSGCAPLVDKEEWIIRDNGSVRRTTDAARLTYRVQGVNAPCVYDVIWPASLTQPGGVFLPFSGVFLPSGGSFLALSEASPTVQGNSVNVTASYRVTQTEFSPELSPRVADVDEDNDDRHDFAGTRLDVRISPATDSRPECSAPQVERWEILQDGSLTKLDVTQLVDRPLGLSYRCKYWVTFPNSNSAPADSSPDADLKSGNLFRTSERSVNIQAIKRTASVSYLEFQTKFLPEVAVSVPDHDDDNNGINDFSGTDIRVSFTPVAGSNAGCTSSANGLWRVQDDGRLKVSASAPLVNLPRGSTSHCSYDVSFAASSQDRALTLVSTASTVISAVSEPPSPSAAYVNDQNTLFDVVFDVTAPFVDYNGDGSHDHANTLFRFSIAAVEGSPIGCDRSRTAIFQVQPNGQLFTDFPFLVDLVDRPARSEARCEYTIEFQDQGGLPDRLLVLTSAGSATFSGALPSVSARYVTSGTEFLPDVSATVPVIDADDNGRNDLEGTMITATFVPAAGASPSCSSGVSRTLRIDNSGSATRASEAVELVNRVNGESSRCEYDVEVPTVTSGDEVLAPDFAQRVFVSAASPSASVSYVKSRTTFRPAVDVKLPDFDVDDDGRNDFTGIPLTVALRAVAGSHAGLLPNRHLDFAHRR